MSINLQSVKQRFGIIGRSPILDRALSTAIRVAPTDLTVLITGGSGVGKEAFFKYYTPIIYQKNIINLLPLIVALFQREPSTLNYLAMPREHFTGANSDRKGYFETVDGGTVFLDEIGEMPLDTQTYLLRVLETGEFIRVGSSKPQKN